MLVKSEAIFRTCLSNNGKQVIGGIMLPNTTHMGRKFDKKAYKALISLHLAKHHLSFIDTSHLIVDIDEKEAFIQPKRDVKKNKQLPRFSFNNAYHRFKKGSLKDSDLSEAQATYLNSKVISHAWAAIHNGIVVGMVFFPILKDNTPNNPKFIEYLSDANVLLKKIGYFVSGDLVITESGELKFFRVLKNKSLGNIIQRNWTQELILTKSIKTLLPINEEE